MPSFLPTGPTRLKVQLTVLATFTWCALGFERGAAEDVSFPGTAPLTMSGDLSAQMVDGIDRFLRHELDRGMGIRSNFWHRDFTSRDRYEHSIAPNRERFRRAVGAVDDRVNRVRMELVGATDSPAKVVETRSFTAYAVRWPVLEGVNGEGLLLEPKGKVVARVIAIPDADQTPEMLAGLSPGVKPDSQFARRLVEQGCQVLVPVLISRENTWSGNEVLRRFTNQPHREWIYRQAYELGRHIIGYEVEKMLAAVDWMVSQEEQPATGAKGRIGIAGYGEGGLIAFYSAALDPRIDATLVSGYFGPRQRVWEEPIYRNVFGLLREFGDAEIASLVAPRALIIEYSECPKVDGPPAPSQGRNGAAPGKLVTPERIAVEQELERARAWFPNSFRFEPELAYANEGQTVAPGSSSALTSLLQGLKVSGRLQPSGPEAIEGPTRRDPGERQKRQLAELVAYTQHLLLTSERARDEGFWRQLKVTSQADWTAKARSYQTSFWDNVIGRLPPATAPANPRLRKILEKPKWTGYEVVLDVYPDVYAWGILLVPKDLKPGERRPVIVCQHGLEGVPMDTIDDNPAASGYGPYKAFAARLAEKGYITFAPHNPYRGHDQFRGLQRKANPLGLTLFSVILAQHDRILDWLSGLSFVDAQRMAFYGLSYGGKTAMRVPSLLDRYCLSICSADFNDWVKKNVTTESPYSYVFTGEYELPEFDLGHTFNYAEMAALIAPRPFMVERGHNDGVAPDEWVAYEYAKVRRWYASLGIPERTRIEFFNGPHTINGVGTFEFLEQHLNWPAKR